MEYFVAQTLAEEIRNGSDKYLEENIISEDIIKFIVEFLEVDTPEKKLVNWLNKTEESILRSNLIAIILGLKINIATSTTEANAKYATDSEILIQFYQGYKWAFDELYRRYYFRCIYYAQRHIQEPEEIQDIITETFLNFWLNKIIIEEIVFFQHTLFHSILSNARKRYQKNKREEKHTTLIEVTELNEINDIETISYSFKELKCKVVEAIDKLDNENERNVVNLTLQNKTNEEIARFLKMSEEAIFQTKRRAIQHLKNLMLNNLI